MPLHSLPDDNHHDFVAELTHRMARFLLSDDDTLHSSPDSISGSAEGCSQEPSPSAAPEERSRKNNYGKLQSFNIGLYSHQSLVQEQIRAIELSGVKQDQVAVSASAKQKPAPRRKNLGQTYEPKKGNVRRATRPPRPGPQHQGGAGMRALFLDGPGSRGGTGVFLPRAGAPTPSESTNKQGKGCSTVLIPARVLQALQLHFDQMAATSGPKAGAFHPLHDVVVSDRDGMYSLQNHEQSQKAATSIQNETILPQEWAY
ncbi:uncharacterized protein LOC114183545 [Vigna unguiculata]|uniref:Uncharacterized protein n=1 Tax=Vigna unguiculata TaxID=3917 RepID=A0A4D6N5V6_VIGUN|nr:uncharacterized protein LOC114183545 [Vigna unguiculata]QCE09190.1 hypothetical protein DEO72_LG10g409 [Vigna unguiculata]